jgi:phage-related protein
MADTVSEIVVKARPEGIQETEDGLGELEQSLQESGNAMQDISEQTDEIQSTWQGAMDALVAGLAVAAGGLLSQVPVLGSVFEGLLSIVKAVAYQMDKVLRPVLQPVANLLFQISEALFELDGPLGRIVGGIATLATIIGGVVVPLAALASKLGLAASTGAALKAVGGAIVTALGAVASALGLPVVVVGALIAALGLLAFYFRDELGTAIKIAIGLLKDFLIWVGKKVEGAFGWAKDAFNSVISLASDLWGWLQELGGWILGGFTGALDWLQTAINDPKQAAKELSNTLEDIAESAFNTVVEISYKIADAINPFNIEGGVAGIGGTAEDPGVIREAGQGVGDFIGGLGAGTSPGVAGNINMDGRRVDERTGRHRFDRTTRRGG